VNESNPSERLRDGLNVLQFLARHQGDWTANAYPGIAVGLLLPRNRYESRRSSCAGLGSARSKK